MLYLFRLDSNKKSAPITPCGDPWDRDVPSLESVVPLDSTAAYNMLDVIHGMYATQMHSLIFILYLIAIVGQFFIFAFYP